MPRLSVTAPGPAARAALWAAIADAQRDDPLHPVTVAVPSPYAGLSLRRELAARSGLANVHFVALNRIAELLGAPFLGERRRPLTEPLDAEATRLALLDVGRALDASPRTVDAVVRTRREAARSGIHLDGELAQLDEAVRARLADFYDDEDQLQAAARVVAEDPSRLEDLGTVVWYLPLRVTPGAAALARALDGTGRLRVVAVSTGDVAADRVLDDLAAALDEPEARDEAGPERATPHGTEILVAPDHDTEVRAVAAQILALAAAGTPFHRVAVTFTHDEPYLRLAHARLTAAGIPVAGPSSRRLAETAAGRVVCGMLTALDDELSRESVLDLLTVAPLRGDLATPATVARWEAISRHAGILGGSDEIRPLVEVLDALIPPSTPTDDATWRARAEHTERVLDLLLGDGSHLPTEEQDALVEVRAALRSLTTLATLGGGSSADDAFADAARAALDRPFGRAGVIGTGVLVAPMTSLSGTACDVVFVLGLDERATRSAALDDPLLPGHDLVRARRDRHRGAYLAALATAPRRVLSLPRADLRAQRATTPSPWVLESAAALAGGPVAAQDLCSGNAQQPWLRTIASFEALIADDPSAPDDARLAALAAHRRVAGSSARIPDDLVDADLARAF